MYEVGGWRPGIDPPGQRWGATCARGEVIRAHTRDEVRAQLADHDCDPNETAFFKRASTDADWVAAQLATLPGGRPAPPQRGLGDTVEVFDSADFDRQGRLFRSALQHWIPALRVTGEFQTGSVSLRVDAGNERGLAQFLGVVLTFPDEPSVVRLYLEPDTNPSPGQLSNLRFDFGRERQVAAAVLLAVGKDDRVYQWMSRGEAGRDDVVLAHDTWNVGDKRFPPEAFVTVAALREAVSQWAFGEGVFRPRGITWVPTTDVGWF